MKLVKENINDILKPKSEKDIIKQFSEEILMALQTNKAVSFYKIWGAKTYNFSIHFSRSIMDDLFNEYYEDEGPGLYISRSVKTPIKEIPLKHIFSYKIMDDNWTIKYEIPPSKLELTINELVANTYINEKSDGFHLKYFNPLNEESMGDILRPKTGEEINRVLSKLSQEKKNNQLINASREGHKDVVEMLLKVGVDVNAKDKGGYTALIWTSINGHKDIVEILLKAGADVNAKTKDGVTALMWVSYNAHKDIVEVLLKAGADVNAKNKFGDTALMWAFFNGHKNIVELLIKAGADVNSK